jgi:hypothetical protein
MSDVHIIHINDLDFDFPEDWADKILSVAAKGVHVVKHGVGPGSLESEATAGLDYIVTTGHTIEHELPFLFDFFNSKEMIAKASELFGEPVKAENHHSGISINLLMGANKRYELHLDDRPYTVLLFANTLNYTDGGDFVYLVDDEEFTIQPGEGRLVFFDGSKIPHKVEPLKRMTVRLSIPMHYRPVAEVSRTDAIDNYLFEEA